MPFNFAKCLFDVLNRLRDALTLSHALALSPTLSHSHAATLFGKKYSEIFKSWAYGQKFLPESQVLALIARVAS